ncbi:MAG: heavy metal translocating P-type ATPase [Candidatus Zixiibacteriota bacterium]
MPQLHISNVVTCCHCGASIDSSRVEGGDEQFCCQGCRTVHRLLVDQGLDRHYSRVRSKANAKLPDLDRNRYSFLDDAAVRDRFVEYSDGSLVRVTLSLPTIHCSSCIVLLENLYRLDGGISSSTVNFLRRELTLLFDENQTALRSVVELLVALGYEPSLSLEEVSDKDSDNRRRSLYLRIGVAGFCFGNVMLLSFPEYLSSDSSPGVGFQRLFGLTSLVLSLPVLLYGAVDFFRSAWSAVRRRMINMDVPIALGIAILFARSGWEVAAEQGTGYFDSFTGLVFFLLLGRLFQMKTYDRLSFDRTYRSYFPAAVLVRNGESESTVPIEKLQPGDRMIVRNRELVPADSVLIEGHAILDYSFVSGEAEPREKASGDRIYAGARQLGSALELEVIRPVSQSRLTSLWSNEVMGKTQKPQIMALADRVSKYFTIVVLAVAVVAGIYWARESVATAISVTTAVLIVACPCALALSTPFALGSATRWFGRNRFFVRGGRMIEALATVDTVVFDKTGTITSNNSANLFFDGPQLGSYDKSLIRSLVRQSVHPLSRLIYYQLSDSDLLDVTEFVEKTSAGLSAIVDGHRVRIGTHSWAISLNEKSAMCADDPNRSSGVHISIDGKTAGQYRIKHPRRPGIGNLIARMRSKYRLSVLSGDSDRDRKWLRELFGDDADIRFGQSPQDKLEHVQKLQSKECRVVMVGDGLNDSGGLKQADVGIAVSEDTSAFSPACDGIIDAAQLHRLDSYIGLAKRTLRIIKISFGISFLYNIVGIGFAVQGLLTPLVAAVLMPLSSISVVLFASVGTSWSARREGL